MFTTTQRFMLHCIDKLTQNSIQLWSAPSPAKGRATWLPVIERMYTKQHTSLNIQAGRDYQNLSLAPIQQRS